MTIWDDYARLETFIGDQLPDDDRVLRRLGLMSVRAALAAGHDVQSGPVLIRPADLWPDGDSLAGWRVADA